MTLSAVFSDVLLKPSNLSFYPNEGGVYSPIEVLIANRSSRSLRFRVLSTDRSKYSLSKTKGVLNAGCSTKLAFDLKSPITQDVSKDFFKLQFFDYDTDTFAGERYIGSSIHASANYRAFNSDSCSSWPAARQYSIKRASVTRTASLNRTVDQLLPPSRGTSPVLSKSSSLRCFDPQFSITSFEEIPENIGVCTGTTRQQYNTLQLAAPALPPKPAAGSSGACYTCLGLKRLAYLLAFSACIIGVCLPGLPSRPIPPNPVVVMDRPYCTLPDMGVPHRGQAGETPGPSACVNQPNLLTSRERRIALADLWPSRVLSLLTEQFSRETLFAILEDVWASIHSVLWSISAVTVIANMSWFCLGLLTMYHLKER